LKIFANRKFAILFTVIVVILATLIGVRQNLNRLARNVEKMFYEGVYIEDARYTQPGIDTQLKNVAQASLDCATALEGHPGLAKECVALLSARDGYMSANTIADKYSANEKMKMAFDALAQAADGLVLSARETEIFERHSLIFRGAQRLILSNLYNEKAKAFMDDVSFPANFLMPFLFVAPPQLFA